MNKKNIKIIVIILLMIISDQILKIYFTGKHIQIVSGLLGVEYTRNFGVAFGVKYDMIIILIMNLILLGILSYLIIKKFNERSIIYSLVMILGGGISNFLDRVIYGYVRDYVDIYFVRFPKFNLADIAIVLGIIIIIIQICLKKEKST